MSEKMPKVSLGRESPIIDTEKIRDDNQERLDAVAFAANPIEQLKKQRDENQDYARTLGLVEVDTLAQMAMKNIWDDISTIHQYRMSVTHPDLITYITGTRFTEQSDYALFSLLKDAGYTLEELSALIESGELEMSVPDMIGTTITLSRLKTVY